MVFFDSRRNRLTILFVLSLVCMDIPTSAAPFVPGDVILKFTDGSESDVAVTQAGQPDPRDLHFLASVVDRLQTKAEVPLRLKQILSGRRILISIDGDKLIERLVAQLREREHVAAVEVREQRSKNKELVSLSNKVWIEFVPGSAESESVKQRPSEAHASGFATLLSDLERDLHLPLKGEVDTHAHLLLQVEFIKLTTVLVDRLKTLADIETAQPNYVMRIK